MFSKFIILSHTSHLCMCYYCLSLECPCTLTYVHNSYSFFKTQLMLLPEDLGGVAYSDGSSSPFGVAAAKTPATAGKACPGLHTLWSCTLYGAVCFMEPAGAGNRRETLPIPSWWGRSPMLLGTVATNQLQLWTQVSLLPPQVPQCLLPLPGLAPLPVPAPILEQGCG